MKMDIYKYIKKSLSAGVLFLVISECVFADSPNIKSVVITSFNQKSLSLAESEFFLDFKEGKTSFKHSLEKWLKDKHPQFSIKAKNINENLFQLIDRSDFGVYKVDFYFNKHPICLVSLKAQLKRKAISILGFEPGTVTVKGNRPFPQQSVSINILKNNFSAHSFTKATRCFYPDQGVLNPVWKIDASIKDMPYRFWVDQTKVYKKSKLFFEADHVDAKIQAYAINPIDSELEIFTKKVSGFSILENEFITTDTNKEGSGVARAKSDTHEFIYDPSHKNFPEANVFLHADNMLNFFKKLGYSWVGEKPLVLKLHRLISGSKSNALYKPFDASFNNGPSITIGDGDGDDLKNLNLDSDVVSHELGHHIIFQYITETSGDSLLLHEGLSDYFTFAKNNDSCLGESICVVGGGSCYIDGKCLRTANNNLKYDGELYRAISSQHIKSQLISGFLWDLHQKIDKDKITSLVFDSLKLLVTNTNISQWLAALMIEDHNLHNGENSCTIYDTAVKRGLSSLLDDIDCANLTTISLPVETEKKHSQDDVESETDRSNDRSWCGGVFYKDKQPPPWWGFIFLIPVFFALNLRQKRINTLVST